MRPIPARRTSWWRASPPDRVEPRITANAPPANRDLDRLTVHTTPSELAAKTRRIERAGRKFAYVLKEGEPRLAIDQADVRAVQLAKAALYAGAKLLIEKRGCGPPRRVTLVGVFGSSR